MKALSLVLSVFLLLTACAQPGKDTSAPAKPAPAESDDNVGYQAGLLSQAYENWKSETNAIAWKDSDPKAFELAEAYTLGLRISKFIGPTRVEIILWLLENFKTIKNPSPEGTEMKSLAKEYINKDLKL